MTAPATNKDFNKDELEAPQWLNAEFFGKVLSQYESKNAKDVQIKTVQLSPATIKGDHYASVMFRAVVKYACQGAGEQQKSMIIKIMPEVEGHKMELLQESHIFETEIGMYTEVIPKFEQMLKAAGDNTKLAAPCLYYSLQPKKVIILEDIVPLGYAVVRKRHIKLEEAQSAYAKLAKWHALSYKIAQENAHFFDKYRHGLMTMTSFTEGDFFKSGIDLFIEVLQTAPALQKYIPYFEKMQKKLLAECKNSFMEYREQPQAQHAYVLCHGDFHGRNLMFKRDERTNELLDVMLLDFQMCYMGPLANDLIYSSYMLLVDTDLRLKHFDQLLDYYFTIFAETLEKIGYKAKLPTIAEFKAQQLRQRYFEIFLLVTFSPLWYGAFEDNRNLEAEQVMTSMDIRRRLYQRKEFIEDLHIILPKYLHLGYFENL